MFKRFLAAALSALLFLQALPLEALADGECFLISEAAVALSGLDEDAAGWHDGMTPSAVSYTHLDVYKRQALRKSRASIIPVPRTRRFWTSSTSKTFPFPTTSISCLSLIHIFLRQRAFAAPAGAADSDDDQGPHRALPCFFPYDSRPDGPCQDKMRHFMT